MSRRITYVCLLLLCVMPVMALHVRPVGEPDKDYTFVANDGDSIYIFADEIHMRSSDGSAIEWYDAATNVAIATGAEDIYPDEGSYYTMQNGEKEYFYVFSYKNYKADVADWTLEVEPKCEYTLLTLTGTLPKPIAYTNGNGDSCTVQRECTISYTDLSWNAEKEKMCWQDSTVVEAHNFPAAQFTLPAIYRATDITLTVDNIARALGLDSASVSTELTAPIAIKSHVTHRTEVRGTEKENEIDRPIYEWPTDKLTLEGSGELRTQFYSNPTPAASYFLWRIYKASQLIFTRNDENVFEVFSEPGTYRVVSYVTGSDCPCETCTQDSTEITVIIPESELKVPNVFTPNGDGVNDEFRVQYKSIAEFHCWVYNRWGKLVYYWNDPAKGWDGTINGRPATEGAYFYVIRARGTDAAKGQGYMSKPAYNRAKGSSDTKIVGIYQLSGDINLLRGKSKNQ